MTPADLLSILASRIERKRRDKPLKVALDGRCAAGKSILADELAAALHPNGAPVVRASVDGFHHQRERRYRRGEYSAAGYYEDAYDYQMVIDALLQPLSGDSFPASCRLAAHDVITDTLVSGPPASITANSVLLFDGLFLLRRELNPYWDFRILVHVDAQTSVSRAVLRDSGGDDALNPVRLKYDLRYLPAWQIYTENDKPETKAAVIVDNSDFANPHIVSLY
jgi:uridine kinase